jgi:hypothetical protein
VTAEWDFGVGGAQCDECERITICHIYGGDWDDELLVLCRPCWLGVPVDEQP